MRRWVLLVSAAAVLGVLAFGGGTMFGADGGEGAKAAPAGVAAGKRPLLRAFREAAFRLWQLKDELDVTDEQKASLRKTLVTYKDEFVAAVKGIHAARKKLSAAVRAETTDEAAIRAAAADVGKSIGDMAVLAAKARKDVLAIMTPEQRRSIEAAREAVEGILDRSIGSMGAGAPKP
ncbi:MAG: Spy/CpxP family protein refolding chaperone [Planctomycetota bacterium]